MTRGQAQTRAGRFAMWTGAVTFVVGFVAWEFSHIPFDNAPPSWLRSTLGGGPTSAIWWLLVLAPPLLMLLAGRFVLPERVRDWCTAVVLATVAVYALLLLIAA